MFVYFLLKLVYASLQNLQQTLANEEIYKSLARCGTTSSLRRGAYRQLLSKPVLQLEFAPFINRIISPPLRPVRALFRCLQAVVTHDYLIGQQSGYQAGRTGRTCAVGQHNGGLRTALCTREEPRRAIGLQT